MSLVKTQRRRVDGFYARCLRRILGISHSFYSRVSNKVVYERAGTIPLTQQLAKQQLNLLSTVARSAAGSPLRRNTFMGDSFQPTTTCICHYIRKVGRPPTNWTGSVLQEGSTHFGSQQALFNLISACQWQHGKHNCIRYLRNLLRCNIDSNESCARQTMSDKWHA